jgi:hypothetical protein
MIGRARISTTDPAGDLNMIQQNVPDPLFVWNGLGTNSLSDVVITMEGRPLSLDSLHGPALEFDGERDGILLSVNPIAGLIQFTVETIFRPCRGGSVEQRFLHMGKCHDERLLFETRIVNDEAWYLDTFLASELDHLTLMNTGFHHSLEEWHHAAITFDGSRMVNYVNSQPELSGIVEFTPLQGGKTSIGMRQNKVSWFKGIIGTIRITPRILKPSEFLELK